MNTKLSYAEKLMSLLSGSPEVKVLIDREKSQAAEAEKQARIDCLAQIKILRLAEIEAKQNIDATLSAVDAWSHRGGHIHRINSSEASA